MAIGRSEDRDTPRDPLVRRHHQGVWDPIRETHLGLRSRRPHTQAGHMTATDRDHRSCLPLRNGGRPHMGPGLRLASAGKANRGIGDCSTFSHSRARQSA
jgi:hypothetical protein